jgi:hypothetical protein
MTNINKADKRLACDVSLYVLRDSFGQQRNSHLRSVADMGGDNAIRKTPQRVPSGKWLRIGDI